METNENSESGCEARRQQWREHMERQPQSGKTVAGYCTEHGLKTWQFWYWRRALSPKVAEAGFVQLAPVAQTGVTLLIGGCRIGIERGFDPAVLRDVVAALMPA